MAESRALKVLIAASTAAAIAVTILAVTWTVASIRYQLAPPAHVRFMDPQHPGM